MRGLRAHQRLHTLIFGAPGRIRTHNPVAGKRSIHRHGARQPRSVAIRRIKVVFNDYNDRLTTLRSRHTLCTTIRTGVGPRFFWAPPGARRAEMTLQGDGRPEIESGERMSPGPVHVAALAHVRMRPL